ncbi:MAG: helix-turn-helix domain-containing protein [Pseudomonadota bacterium]
MSIQHVSLVLNSRDERLGGTKKLVLICLANRTDADGQCWPSQDLIAEEAGTGVRSVQNHLKALEDDGFITRETEAMGQGRGARTVYAINLAALAPAEHADANNAPANNAHANFDVAHEESFALHTKKTSSHRNLQKNLQEPTSQTDCLTDQNGQSDRSPIEDDGVRWANRIWSEIYPHPANRGGKPKALKMLGSLKPDERKTFEAWCASYAAYLRATDFLNPAMLQTVLNDERWREPIGADPPKAAGQSEFARHMANRR